MIPVIKLTYRGSKSPIFFPVTDEELTRIKDTLKERTDPLLFIESSTVFGQNIFIFLKRIKFINFLLEPPIEVLWDENDIAPSFQYSDKSEQETPEYHNFNWDVLVYLDGEDFPIWITDADGNDWVDITIPIINGEEFLIVNDDDGEDVAIPLDAINCIVGTEINRYSSKQIDEIQKHTLPKEWLSDNHN